MSKPEVCVYSTYNPTIQKRLEICAQLVLCTHNLNHQKYHWWWLSNKLCGSLTDKM